MQIKKIPKDGGEPTLIEACPKMMAKMGYIPKPDLGKVPGEPRKRKARAIETPLPTPKPNPGIYFNR